MLPLLFRIIRTLVFFFLVTAAWPNLVVVFVDAAEATTTTMPTKSWTLSHRVLKGNSNNDVAWTVRGTIDLRLLDDGADNEAVTTTPALTIANAPLDEEFVRSIPDDSAWYQLRIGDDNSNNHQIMTTIPACHVRRANYRDEIVLALNERAQILSLSYDPLISPLAPPRCSAYDTNDVVGSETTKTTTTKQHQFETKVSFSTGHVGMTVGNVGGGGGGKDNKGMKPPPGLKWFPVPRGAAGNGPNGKSPLTGDDPLLGGGEDNNKPPAGPFEFIKRYWYIFLPIVVANLMVSDTAAPAARNNDQAADAGPVTAAGGAAADPQEQQGQPKRRGKKG